MNFGSKVTFVGFLLAVSTLSSSVANASISASNTEKTSLSIESRISRLTKVIQKQQSQQEKSSEAKDHDQLMASWLNGSRGGFLNRRYGGGFLNDRRGGGFLNRRWPDGGRFYRHRYR